MGCSIHIEEVTLNPFLTSEVSDFNFSNADIRPGGYLVNDTAEASAKHSLFRDIENCKSLAANGASINNNNGSINSTAPNGLLFEFESLLDFPPPKKQSLGVNINVQALAKSGTYIAVVSRLSPPETNM